MSVRLLRLLGALLASSILVLGSTSASMAAGDTDVDGDLFLGSDDSCPTLAGPFNGCPDADNDGVPDDQDLCPTVAGTIQGCPQGNHSAGTETDAGAQAETTVTATYQGRGIRGTVTSTAPICTQVARVDVAAIDPSGNVTTVLGNVGLSKKGTFRLAVTLAPGTQFLAAVSHGLASDATVCPPAYSPIETVAAQGSPGR